MIADLRVGLRTFLLADPAIAALVGTRVYPLMMPQGQTSPSIVYTRISGVGDYHMQGPSGLARPRIQIDCYALSADTAVQLANLVKDRMDGYQGDMGTVDVLGVFMDSERDLYDDGTKLHRVSRDFIIWHREF